MHDEWVRFVAAPLAALSLPAVAHAVQYLTVEQAQQLMFGRQMRFKRSDLVYDREVAARVERAAAARVAGLRQPMWRVLRDDALEGFFFVDEVIGKHELITYAVGLGADGRVRQVEILAYREAYGFEIRNPAWRAQFVGKSRADSVKLDQDIKNISGATLSCRHVTEGIRRILALHDQLLRAD